MRGPGIRLKLDVRRRWRCPQCGSERKLPASVTSVRCSCTPEAPFLSIIEGQRRSRPDPEPLDPYLEFELEEETPVPAAVVAVEPQAPVEPAPDEAPAESVAGPTPAESGSTPPQNTEERGGRSRRGRGRNRRRGRDRARGGGKPESPPKSQRSESPPAASGQSPGEKREGGGRGGRPESSRNDEPGRGDSP